MKIAYVITRTDAVGGASIHVRDLARAMIERGHEAVVLAGGAGPVSEQLAAAGIPFRPLRHLRRPIRPVSDLLAVGELKAALDDLRPDLVSTHTAKAGWVGRAAAGRCRLPVLYTPHGLSIGDRISPTQGILFRWAERAASRWGSGIICVCESERQLALQHRIAPPDRLHVVYNGVRDIPQELVAKPEREPIRVVSVARFAPPKDHRTLLEALAAMPAADWRLDLIGDGPGEAGVRALARELGIAGRIRFLGYEQTPEKILADAQVFVISVTFGGFPAVCPGGDAGRTSGCRLRCRGRRRGCRRRRQRPARASRSAARSVGGAGPAGRRRHSEETTRRGGTSNLPEAVQFGPDDARYHGDIRHGSFPAATTEKCLKRCQ